ncbi:MAG: Holliday junction resolvase RecU [Lachnospiraceae bacterium]|nr:Holliday junction resolvase RecU [Lachnospiraceae bacterium]
MATWSGRGLRGSVLEDMINRTNEKYREGGLALVQKIPTPITPITIDKKSSQITLAYFDQKSTVDYIGAVQGIPVCFDAKESASETFSLQNIHEHQVRFMIDFEKQDGVAFFLIYYTKKDVLYYLRLSDMLPFWKRAKSGGRKSFRYDELDESWVLPKKRDVFVPYLDMINMDLMYREERGGSE